jgi:hypothetical protein
MTACASLPCQAGQASSIKAITPNAIDPLGLPVELSLAGKGFVRGTIIGLSHPSNPKSVAKVSPTRIGPERITFTLQGKQLKSLLQTAVAPLPSTKRALTATLQPGFLNVVAISPTGTSSNRVVLHLQDFPVRIRALASPSSTERYPLNVRAGTTRHVNVALERRQPTLQRLTLTVKAFTIADLGAARKPVPGITGSGLVAAGANIATADISIGKAVPPGEYEIEMGIAECVHCPQFSGTVIVEPNNEITCGNCGPLFEPIGVEIFMLYPPQERVGVRWVDQSVREDGFRIEASWGAPITWVPIAEVGPHEGVGVVEWQGRVDAPSWAKPEFHCYRVVVHNSFGELPSQYDCGLPDAPRPPTGLHVLDKATDSVTLEWLDNSTMEERYEVWKAYCRDCTYHLDGSLSGNQDGAGPVQYEVRPLESDHEYSFKIKAGNLLGSSWSDVVRAKTDYQPPPPTAPGYLSLRDITQSSIKLRWRDYAHEEDGFRVQRRPPGGDWNVRHNLPPKEGTGWMDWTDTGLAAGTTYCYRIKVYNDYGWNFSGEQCATTIAGAPSTPDLALDAMWIVEPTTPNVKFHVAYRVCNMGAAVNKNFRDKIVKDDDIASAKTVSQGPVVPANGCYESAVEFDGVPKNSCPVWKLFVDDGNAVTELDENNNYGWLNVCFW